MTVVARTIECTTCRGSGTTESDDSTDGRIYKCWDCDGAGKIADRRAPDPQLTIAEDALRAIASPDCMIRLDSGGWIDTEAPARIAEGALERMALASREQEASDA